MFNVVCTLDRYKTMLTSTEFVAKSNGFRPQEDLTFALNVAYVICNSTLSFNPLSPHDALKHHFTSLKTDLISLQQRVLERKFP